eukprot:8301798-Prorocentrum_lima.AAC.1
MRPVAEASSVDLGMSVQCPDRPPTPACVALACCRYEALSSSRVEAGARRLHMRHLPASPPSRATQTPRAPFV